MYGKSAQQLNKRQDFIKVHVFYKRDKDTDNLKDHDFMHFHLGALLVLSFNMLLVYIFLVLYCSFYGFINSTNISRINDNIFFFGINVLIFFEFSMFIGELKLEFFPDYKFSFIIDPSSLIHEIIHGHIFEKVQGIKKWEVWVVDGKFFCFGYIPESTQFPNFILKSMIARLIHLIHDLITSIIMLDVYYIFDYIKEFFMLEKNYIKELKTQIKARKT